MRVDAGGDEERANKRYGRRRARRPSTKAGASNNVFVRHIRLRLRLCRRRCRSYLFASNGGGGGRAESARLGRRARRARCWSSGFLLLRRRLRLFGARRRRRRQRRWRASGLSRRRQWRRRRRLENGSRATGESRNCNNTTGAMRNGAEPTSLSAPAPLSPATCGLLKVGGSLRNSALKITAPASEGPWRGARRKWRSNHQLASGLTAPAGRDGRPRSAKFK